MELVIDVEANGLKPTKIWVVVCKCVETGELHIFREVTDNVQEKERLLRLLHQADRYIGHNFLGYDYPVLRDLIGFNRTDIHRHTIDTLIVSKLVDYSREGGHSIEQYGKEFGLEKGKFSDWSKYSKEMEDYCVRDVEICARIYSNFSRIILDPAWASSIDLEHRFQLICNDLHDNGFGFDVTSANKLLLSVMETLQGLDKDILKAFPPQEVLIREFIPKSTKYGTINKTSVPRSLWDRIHEYEIGVSYRHTTTKEFNPSSHKQIIQVLNTSGWSPEDKTQTHIDCERQCNILRKKSPKSPELDIEKARLEGFKKTGWRVNEQNLSTLPDSAPPPARLLAKRILLEARRRSLVEWLGLVKEDGRIHGRFQGIGAWSMRMAHQNPNTANIPREHDTNGTVKLLGKELRELWIGDQLVGVDAEGIQLRIFAHLIDDPEFTKALVEGRKNDKTDPHSLNQRVIGRVCKSRQAAKRFIYALLLGAGFSKLAQVLECSVSEAKEAVENLLDKYKGWAKLKRETFPKDAKRGYFLGLDGRQIKIPGLSTRDREHLAMSGYLQSGEAIIVKKAATIIDTKLLQEKLLKKWMFVDIVHDELQSEVKGDLTLALEIAKVKAEAIKEAGEYYKLKCPMAGSYFNEDTKKYTIGKNWYLTH